MRFDLFGKKKKTWEHEFLLFTVGTSVERGQKKAGKARPEAGVLLGSAATV